MESYEIIALWESESSKRRLAESLGRSYSLVCQWGRSYDPDEDPGATGKRNPLAVVDKIFDDALLHNPRAAEIIAERYVGKLEAHYERSATAAAAYKQRLRTAKKDAA